ncbi:hypothetical protein DFH07DRAFT_792156 [Mycena maculata]|uniref:Uncharacterized protein n=1 Tax=Mycena maculata TaxID=230809 RepID=A0AAD7NZM9_9AGAR|nr:hypothetical protein DFH07DRAFT_792156 [Mycena maculata]
MRLVVYAVFSCTPCLISILSCATSFLPLIRHGSNAFKVTINDIRLSRLTKAFRLPLSAEFTDVWPGPAAGVCMSSATDFGGQLSVPNCPVGLLFSVHTRSGTTKELR